MIAHELFLYRMDLTAFFIWVQLQMTAMIIVNIFIENFVHCETIFNNFHEHCICTLRSV